MEGDDTVEVEQEEVEDGGFGAEGMRRLEFHYHWGNADERAVVV